MSAPVRIEGIAAGGDGVGRLEDGRTVFIPRSAPGDLVLPDRLRTRARFARARIGRLLEPGSDRVEPRCTHYREDDCGGCQLQHMASPAQRAARQRIVGDALRRIGRLDLPDPTLEPADREWSYRSRITLSLSRDRTRAGFHRLEAAGSVFELRRCEIADETLNRLLPSLREARRALPPGIAGIALRAGQQSDPCLILRGPTRPTPRAVRNVVAAFRGGGATVSIFWHPRPGITRPLAGAARGWPAGVFEQVNPAMGDRARSHGIRALGEVREQVVWDLYAGLGETTSSLADRGARVESVELNAAAVDWASRHRPHPSVSRHAGRVEDWIGRLPAPDLVSANPPRTGLGSRQVEALRRAAPRRIAYIACDPATLARDLAGLTDPAAAGAAYRIEDIRAFDLFPQTAHVEAVAALVRR